MHKKIKIIKGNDCLKVNADVMCNIILFVFLTGVTVPLSVEEYSKCPKQPRWFLFLFWP